MLQNRLKSEHSARATKGRNRYILGLWLQLHHVQCGNNKMEFPKLGVVLFIQPNNAILKGIFH